MKNIEMMDLDTLIQNLQSTDARYKKTVKIFQVVFFIFIFFYAGLFLVNPDPEITINDRIAGACYVVAFTLFTLVFRKYYKKYKVINYAEPVKKVLEDAEKRYRFWQKDIIPTAIGVILIDAATLLTTLQRFEDKWSFWQIFIVVQIVYFLAIGTGFTIGYIKWRVVNRPIWLNTKKILQEFED